LTRNGPGGSAALKVGFGVRSHQPGSKMHKDRVHVVHASRRSSASSRDQAIDKRLLIVAGFALFWMTAVFVRLGYVQLIQHGDYLAKARRQQQRTIEITPKRGVIYDRNMHPLAMSMSVDSAFASPSEIGENKELAARLLSGVLGIPKDVLLAKFESGGTFTWI